MILSILVVLSTACLNRLRGDARWKPSWAPGRALWYVTPLIGLLAFTVLPWLPAALVALWYLLWATPAWGYLQLLGRPVDGKGPSGIEQKLLGVTGSNVHLAFLLRHLLAGPIAPLILGAYELAWRVRPQNPIIVGELITGALWGLMILMLA
jgi:hypothetical protein